ncbi:MAG: GNAT family N-acetyltransferase [Anaerolineales bacterium]|jgi:GNAT superfamily N-acetyltransferase
MKTTHRNYSEEDGDFNRLARFFTANPGKKRTHTTWCLGRLVDWKYGLYDSKRTYAAFCNENAHLWMDAFGELASFVISEGGQAGFQIFTLPGYRSLFEEILLWVLENWKERPAKYGSGFSTEVTEYQGLETKILEGFGVHPESAFFTHRFYLTDELAPRFPLAPDFVIVDLHSHPDYRAQGVLRANAFQGKDELNDEEWELRNKFYNQTKNGPIYSPQTDLCVMAEDGQFISGCEALINAHALEADIERVCTHSAYCKRGFARAVIQECLYRLRDIGLRNAYITGYSPRAIALYSSLGSTDELKSYFYEMNA